MTRRRNKPEPDDLPDHGDSLTVEQVQDLFGKGQRRPRKYRNRVCYVGEERFDSHREAKRWGQLLLLARAGKIAGLRRQVPFELTAEGGRVVGKYVADFTYTENGAHVVEDSKGFRTDLYKWKKRHMLAQFGIAIRET